VSALTDAATSAPHEPGVYLFRDRDNQLLYVGKASDLRRRLGDHARDQSRTSDLRKRVLLDTVETIHWETCADEAAACAREVDLIVMLKPPFNASHRDQDPDHYVAVTRVPAGTSFELTANAGGPGRAYGTFPHLAKGAFSTVAKRTKAGYNSLLRLLWAHGEPGRDATVPRRIAGSSPPMRFATPVAPELQPLLHDFLSGRSARLLGPLRAAVATGDFAEFTRFALDRDVGAAHEFFALAPRHVRELRLRHAAPPGPLRADAMTALMTREVRETAAAFRPGR
jgi:predicted GIY-YIG superfamily endonuclease